MLNIVVRGHWMRYHLTFVLPDSLHLVEVRTLLLPTRIRAVLAKSLHERRNTMSPSTSPSKNKHRRSPRSDKGIAQLTGRDLDLLRIIGEQTAYSFGQLQGWLARHPDSQSTDPTCLSESRTSALLQRLQKLDLLVYRKILYEEPAWVWCSARDCFTLSYHAASTNLLWRIWSTYFGSMRRAPWSN